MYGGSLLVDGVIGKVEFCVWNLHRKEVKGCMNSEGEVVRNMNKLALDVFKNLHDNYNKY